MYDKRAKQDPLDLWFSMPGEMSVDDFAAELGSVSYTHLDVYKRQTKARDELGWTAEYDMARMCEDGWRGQSQNPDGYGDAE